MRVLFLYNEVESLALQYLSRALRKAGHTTGCLFDPRMFDSFRKEVNVMPGLNRVFSMEKALLDRVEEFQPDVVGFTVLTPNFSWCQSYARQIRERVPGVTIVGGGYHVSAAAKDVLDTKLFDYCFRGEAEDAFVEFCNSLEDGEVDLDIPNLAYLDDEGGYHENPLRPYEPDTDVFDFPDKDLFHGLGSPFDAGTLIHFNRGCPWGCTFCGNNKYRKMYFPDRKDYMYTRDFLRMRSVDHALAEMRWLKENYDPGLLRVNDDDMCADEEWLKEFADRMTDAERIPYKCFVIPNNVNERTVEYLKRSGCEQIQMGVQSLTYKTRRMIGRPNTDEQIAKAVDLIREAGIGLYVDQIFGMPWEGEEDAKKTEQFYIDHPADFVSIYWLDVWAGSDMLNQAVAAGMVSQEEADAIGATIRDGCISTQRDWHGDFMKPYAGRINVRNYFPKSADFLIRTGLWKVVDKLNLFRWKRLWWALKNTFTTDHYPPAREGYDFSWLRFPRAAKFYGGLKLRMWLGALVGRKVKPPMTELPPIGLPYAERKQTPEGETAAATERADVAA
jgi:hypothetical protein